MTIAAERLEAPPGPSHRLKVLGTWGKNLDVMAQDYILQVQEAVRGILGTVEQFERRWQFICSEVLSGRTVEMHSHRDRFLRSFQDRLQQIGEAGSLIQSASRHSLNPLPEKGQLEREADILSKKLQIIASRWQTPEDLEDLAAESLAPSAAKLEAVQQRYGYPQAWYAEDTKPF